MRRAGRLPVAFAMAVVVHAGLLIYGFAPKLDGLTDVPGETAGPVAADASITSPSETAAVAADQDKVLEADAALDIDWPAPEEAQPEQPAPSSEKPKPKSAAPKPEPEPRQAAKPVAEKPKPKPIEADGGSTATVISADASYANRVRQHLARYAGALPPGASGEARVQFVVQPDGRVSNVLLVMKSGNAGLDSVAMSLPTLAQPLPLPGPLPQRLEVPVQAIAAAP